MYQNAHPSQGSSAPQQEPHAPDQSPPQVLKSLQQTSTMDAILEMQLQQLAMQQQMPHLMTRLLPDEPSI